MKYLKFIALLQICCCSVMIADVRKEGIIPIYDPTSLMLAFLPYNPKVIIAGDNIANVAANIARSLECSTVYSFSSEQEDFEILSKYQETLPNLEIYFGLPEKDKEGWQPYYPTVPASQNCEESLRFTGSLFPPTDLSMSFLFGQPCLLPTFSINHFCAERNISKIDYFQLNCGGNELQILKSNPELVKNAIMVCVRTYHKRFRQNLPLFAELDQFMLSCDFELMTHYIHNNIIGDALYVKKKYFNGVFRRKEI